MALLGEILMVWSLWFWIFFLATSGCIIFSIADADIQDKDAGGGLATVIIIATILFLQYIAKTDIFSYVGAHPGEILAWGAGYAATGVGWSLAKWFFFLLNQKEKYQEKKAEYLQDNAYPTEKDIPANRRADFTHILSQYGRKPLVRDNKKRIIVWMMYWPWSILWTFISDFMRKFFNHLYHLLHDTYQNISDHVWSGVEQDIQNYKNKSD